MLGHAKCRRGRLQNLALSRLVYRYDTAFRIGAYLDFFPEKCIYTLEREQGREFSCPSSVANQPFCKWGVFLRNFTNYHLM